MRLCQKLQLWAEETLKFALKGRYNLQVPEHYMHAWPCLGLFALQPCGD